MGVCLTRRHHHLEKPQSADHENVDVYFERKAARLGESGEHKRDRGERRQEHPGLDHALHAASMRSYSSSARRPASASIASSFIEASIVCGLNFARSKSCTSRRTAKELTLQAVEHASDVLERRLVLLARHPVGAERLLHARVGADHRLARVALGAEVVQRVRKHIVERPGELRLLVQRLTVAAAVGDRDAGGDHDPEQERTEHEHRQPAPLGPVRRRLGPRFQPLPQPRGTERAGDRGSARVAPLLPAAPGGSRR